MHLNYGLRILILMLFCWYRTINIHSQVCDSTINKLKNSGNTGSSLLGGITYYSNTNTLGIYTDNIVQPSVSPSIGYLGKSGLILSVTPLFIANADSTFNNTATEIDFQAGYRWELNSHISLTPSYIHFYYSKNMNILRSAFSDYFDLSLTGQWKWFFETITSAYVFGSENVFIIENQSGLNISFDKITGKNQLLFIQPSVTLNFNNQYYYNYLAYVYFKFLLRSRFYQDHPDATVGDFKNYLTYYPYDKTVIAIDRFLDRHPRIDKAFKKLKDSTPISSLFIVNTKFNLSYIEIPFPITYAYRNMVFRLSATAYKPLNAPSFIDSNWNFMYNLGVSYLFHW